MSEKSPDFSPLAASLREKHDQDERIRALEEFLQQWPQTVFEPVLAERFGRILLQHAAPATPGTGLPSPTRVLLLGQCTTSWLKPHLVAVGFGERRFYDIEEGGYDNVAPTLLDSAIQDDPPDLVILLPWMHQLPPGGLQEKRKLLAETIQFWEHCWQLVKPLKRTRILQVGYDWIHLGAAGLYLGHTHGEPGFVREINQQLRDKLPTGASFLDLEQLSSLTGKDSFYDARRYHWTRQPFSEKGCLALSRALNSGIRAQVSGSRKVLVVDLDNTLWGGIVGETGASGIEIGDSPDGNAFRAFQIYLKSLTTRGILLAVASKNNPADAREPFDTHPDMVLKFSDFAAFEASWQPKAVALRTIAETLRLGTDSMVFFDDNPAERAHIRATLPEVCVVNVSEEPANYISDLEEGMWFESVALTDEDRLRSAQYQQEQQREALQQALPDLDAYLTSLEMEGYLSPFTSFNTTRVTQLIAKTNQFNLTVRRHGIETVEAIRENPDHIGLCLHVRDRFGDHGLVSVVIAKPHPERPRTLDIDTWLMSCRVIGRTAEHFFMNNLIRIAQDHDYLFVSGTYCPGKKNQLVENLFSELGFSFMNSSENGEKYYELEIDRWQERTTFLSESSDS